MGTAAARFEQFLITLPCAVVIAVIFVLVMHRMVMAEIPPMIGFPIMVGLMFLLFWCVWPPHPAMPGIIIVTLIAMAIVFPFAESRLVELELKEVGIDRLERALQALLARPDNVAAKFELARQLYAAGFSSHAIAIGQQAVASVSDIRDEVSNRSLRDSFRPDISAVAKMTFDGKVRGMECPCGEKLVPGQLTCACGRNVVLDIARRPLNKRRLLGKVLLALIAVAVAIVGGAAIGLSSDGTAKLTAVGGLVAVVGVALFLLFGPARRLNTLWE